MQKQSKYIFYKDEQVISFQSLDELKEFVTSLLVEINKQYDLFDQYTKLYNQVLSFTESEVTIVVTKTFTIKDKDEQSLELFTLSKFHHPKDDFIYAENLKLSFNAIVANLNKKGM